MENNWTDKQIYDAALEEWYGVLATLWTAAGKPIEEERLRIYGEDLSDVPLGLLETSLQRLRSTHVYANVPQIAEIRDAIKKELGFMTIQDWLDNQWANLPASFNR
jgi:hypothetical protein